MADNYKTKQQSVTAMQFTFDVVKDIYIWLGMKDYTVNVKSRTLSGIITGSNDERLVVQKNNWIVKDSSGNVSIYTADDFSKNFVKE